MKKIILAILIGAGALLGAEPETNKVASASAPITTTTNKAPRLIYVKPYTRKDGIQVRGHYKTTPNGTKADNLANTTNKLTNLKTE